MEWNVDPVLIDFGFLQIRYYGLFFAAGIFIGYLLWKWQMLREGFSEEVAEAFVMWGFLAVLIGARLGHCLFYEPQRYIENPLEVFMIWKGGLASHGASIALAITLYCYHRYYKVPLLKAMDCFAMPTAVAATTVRFGNFMNSEIVGRVTDVPWAIKFPRYTQYMSYVQGKKLQPLLRHPSQLYEAAMGIAILLTLFIVDRKLVDKKEGKNRPLGLMAGLFLVLYFTARFLVEYVKEYQTLPSSFPLTMGQILSIPFALAGYALLFWVYKNRNKQEEIKNTEKEEEISTKKKNQKVKKKKSKKK